jgi:hypothetical protein
MVMQGQALSTRPALDKKSLSEALLGALAEGIGKLDMLNSCPFTEWRASDLEVTGKSFAAVR